MKRFYGAILVVFVLATLALLPALHRSDASLSAEEVKKCRFQAYQLFENAFERIFLPHFTVYKKDTYTYYVRVYLLRGIPYDGAVINVSEPYNEAKYAGKKYVEEQWNCEGSMARIGFRQAAPERAF